MHPASDPAAVRDLTLQKIGRNVVNFQKMEAMLKFILAFADISVPLSDLQASVKAKSKALRRQGMGTLVDRAATTLHAKPLSLPHDASVPWITQSFRLEGGDDQKAEWRRQLRAVVRERNSLIHKTLGPWDPHSVDSCYALCEQLDAQRERIIVPYQHLESLVKAIRESHAEAAQEIDRKMAGHLRRRIEAA